MKIPNNGEDNLKPFAKSNTVYQGVGHDAALAFLTRKTKVTNGRSARASVGSLGVALWILGYSTAAATFYSFLVCEPSADRFAPSERACCHTPPCPACMDGHTWRPGSASWPGRSLLPKRGCGAWRETSTNCLQGFATDRDADSVSLMDPKAVIDVQRAGGCGSSLSPNINLQGYPPSRETKRRNPTSPTLRSPIITTCTSPSPLPRLSSRHRAFPPALSGGNLDPE